MEKVEKIINTLSEKIKLLVEENKMLKQRVSELTSESSTYRNLSEERERALVSLESKSQVLTAARQLEHKSDPDRVKGKIDGLVREIDKCINLLSR